ncbi:uncharacterized protein HKW66_Vig0123910 [Vigna angularis]|uniref:Uncharacterized protein n=2 Tax=Phaseolus angularis TaxID=3914 RepID=A0A8T0JXA0_PHAAN|nr:uncharacterized protein LOC108345167 [Vigna angularis]KAG2385299.1 uncharacterized protein HKW66_Vig0123910 [Vigna angularis]BAU02900.1 hypothetical protein VIGAN_11249600 [Vigna angularis var. angularis]
MGNSLGVVVDNYIGSVPYPCHLQLGPSTSIDLSRNLPEPPENDLFMENETWSVTYRVEKKRCRVQLIRIYPTSWSTETDSILWTKRNTSFDAWGAVKETQVDLYGSGGRWGLLAVESKRNKKEQEAEVVTVMHYIVKSSGTPFYRSTGTDIGLSVVAKFRISNGKFQITGEGLEQHPVSSLLYMFDEVKRTGIWKPTMCPHCDHKRKGKMFWQSDSEDSDSVSMPLLPATLRNSRGVSNGGRFRGNGNGNIYEGNVMVYKR